MADVVLSSCCYNLVYSATSFSGMAGYSPGTVYSITEDTNLPDGCYTIITGVTGTTVTFNGNTTSVSGCTEPSCQDCCSSALCIDINNSTYSGYSGNYQIRGGFNSYPYWTGGTGNNGFIYYNGTFWCLSPTLGGSCLFFGSLLNTFFYIIY
jgi:hypothetical protein